MNEPETEVQTNNRDVIGLGLIGLGCYVAAQSFTAADPRQQSWFAFAVLLLFGAGMLSIMTSETMLTALDRAGEGVKNVWG